MTKKLTSLALMISSACFAQSQTGLETRPSSELFKASIVSVAASTTFHVVSSWDSYHMGSGVYGAKDAARDSGISAGIVAAEYFVARRHPKLRKIFSMVNFGLSEYHLSAGIHNSLRSNPADVNRDGTVNILDLQTRINQPGWTGQDVSYIEGHILK